MEALSARFQASVRRIGESGGPGGVPAISDTSKLRLYGLYKSATAGEPPVPAANPSRKDALKAQAWQEAWAQVGGRADVARQRYCEVVDELLGAGTTPTAGPAALAGIATLKRGPLWKKKEKSEQWMRRFFELRGEVLFFFEHEPKLGEDELPQGFFLLSGTLIEVIKDPVVDDTPVKKFAFCISHPKSRKRFTVACESSEERDQWIAQLQALALSSAAAAAAASSSAALPATASSSSVTTAGANNHNNKPPPSLLKRSNRPPLFRSPSGRAVDLYSVPQAFAGAVDQMVDELLSRCDPNDTTQWTFFKESSQTRIWSLRLSGAATTSASSASLTSNSTGTTSSSRIVGCLGERTFTHASMGEVWEAVWKFGERKRYETSLDALHLVETLGPQTRVEHLCYAATWPTSRRQFTRLYHYRVLDSCVLVAGKSVEHPIAPNYDDAVLANLLLTGFVIQPLTPTSCKVSYLIIVDPCISGVPHTVVAYTTCLQAMILNKIESHILAQRGGADVPPRVIVVENTHGGASALHHQHHHHTPPPPSATATSASTTQFLRVGDANSLSSFGGGRAGPQEEDRDGDPSAPLTSPMRRRFHLLFSFWSFSQRYVPNLFPVCVLTFVFAESMNDVLLVSMCCSLFLVLAFVFSPRQFVRFQGTIKVPTASSGGRVPERLRLKVERALPFQGFFWMGRWWGGKRYVGLLPDATSSFVTAHLCYGVSSLEPHEAWSTSAALLCVDESGNASLSLDVWACEDLRHCKRVAAAWFKELNSVELEDD